MERHMKLRNSLILMSTAAAIAAFTASPSFAQAAKNSPTGVNTGKSDPAAPTYLNKKNRTTNGLNAGGDSAGTAGPGASGSASGDAAGAGGAGGAGPGGTGGTGAGAGAGASGGAGAGAGGAGGGGAGGGSQ